MKLNKTKYKNLELTSPLFDKTEEPLDLLLRQIDYIIESFKGRNPTLGQEWISDDIKKVLNCFERSKLCQIGV